MVAGLNQVRAARDGVVLGLAVVLGICSCFLGASQARAQASPETPPNHLLVIETDSALPDTYPGARYEIHLHARGGVAPLHWRWSAAVPGLSLEDDGTLHGKAGLFGELHFLVTVSDSGQPLTTVQKMFAIRVLSGLVVNWKTGAHVNGNRIEGSVAVTNTTRDEIDLTFDVKAVAENGRATEIGYQHFFLPPGTIEKELPFGETLAHGGYVVHVDAVGEVESKKLIYRQRIQTPGALQVTVGP